MFAAHALSATDDDMATLTNVRYVIHIRGLLGLGQLEDRFGLKRDEVVDPD